MWLRKSDKKPKCSLSPVCQSQPPLLGASSCLIALRSCHHLQTSAKYDLCEILFYVVDALMFFLLHCCFKGEPRLPGAWVDQQEHAGTHPAHFWWRPAADLHTNAKRLVSPLHELPGLQKSAQHAVRAVSWILDTVLTCDMSLLSSFTTLILFFFFCPVTSA